MGRRKKKGKWGGCSFPPGPTIFSSFQVGKKMVREMALRRKLQNIHFNFPSFHLQ